MSRRINVTHAPVVALPALIAVVYVAARALGAERRPAIAWALSVVWIVFIVWGGAIWGASRRRRRRRRAAALARRDAVTAVAATGVVERWVFEELRQALFEAEVLHDPDAARRCAELYELVAAQSDNPAWFRIAAGWWREAAHLGDEDAVEYVRHILEEDGR